MTQFRYHNYGRALISFDENRRILGVAGSGRLNGFDQIQSAVGNLITLNHSLTGIQSTNLDGSAGALRGAVQSKQGVIVQEDTPIEVNVDFNAGNGSERVDLLVMTHSFIAIAGGSIATYAVIKGALGQNFPTNLGLSVSNPLTQVAIGRFLIPANAVDHSGTKYEPLKAKVSENQVPFGAESESNLKDLTTGITLADFNRVIRPGIYTINSTTNRPTSATTSWMLMIMASAGKVVQMAWDTQTGKTYTRYTADNGANWTSWNNLNNVDISASLTALQTAVGSLDYPSNVYVTDGASLTTSVGVLDAALSSVSGTLAGALVNISNILTAIGNQNYSSNAYVTDGTSLTTAIGALDASLLAAVTALNAAIAAINPGNTAWSTGVTWGSGWSNGGGSTPFGFKVVNGLLYVKGLVNKATPTDNEAMFTLPGGSRPAGLRVIPIYPNGGTKPHLYGAVFDGSSGDVRIRFQATDGSVGSVAGGVFLDNIALPMA